MMLSEIYEEFYKQNAFAESRTGKYPKRVIFGINNYMKLVEDCSIIFFDSVIDKEKRNVMFHGLFVTIDYVNKDIIKVVPEV